MVSGQERGECLVVSGWFTQQMRLDFHLPTLLPALRLCFTASLLKLGKAGWT